MIAFNATARTTKTAAETKETIFNEIRTTWGKFSEEDLSALLGNSDLVTKLAAKYGLEQAQAQRDVDALLKGRQI